MSIKAYVGIMGSGKTYEVVTVVIYNALKRGRRVVSNIAGLNFEAMKAAMLGEGVEESRIGELVCIPHEKVLEPKFWRTDHDQEDDIEAFIQGGDLLALDEIWRFWNGLGPKSEDGKEKRPDRVMNFIRMHRQMLHPVTGVCCDLAIITQDPADIHRSVRGVIEETYQMTKLTAIGSDSRYRVDCFQKTRLTRRPLTSHQRSYDPAKFAFYQSHSQKKAGDADAVEENIDGRGNILRGALFKVVLPVGALVMLGAFYVVFSFFNPKPKDNKAAVAANQAKPGAAQPANVSHAKAGPELTDDWRAAGYYGRGGDMAVVLSAGRSLRVLQNPPNVKLSALGVEVVLPSGEVASGWTGVKSGGLVEGMK
ncbi:zonular occludens toxin domain-containing protein [Sulfuritalea sp.]|uniref:zonular occludens toxin domain-containing protein n=1 Tax=Sulfuritalea sp. TaxID=2480090 RepID=UPI00286DA20A|nr:zonular occludens toxin domain-containing protein [Sulfuritalea sp.]